MTGHQRRQRCLYPSAPPCLTFASPTRCPFTIGARKVDAFVACGGNPDETGSADVSKIIKIIKTDFGLDVDIEGIIDNLDVDGAGQLGFAQFKEMLTAS